MSTRPLECSVLDVYYSMPFELFSVTEFDEIMGSCGSLCFYTCALRISPSAVQNYIVDTGSGAILCDRFRPLYL